MEPNSNRETLAKAMLTDEFWDRMEEMPMYGTNGDMYADLHEPSPPPKPDGIFKRVFKWINSLIGKS